MLLLPGHWDACPCCHILQEAGVRSCRYRLVSNKAGRDRCRPSPWPRSDLKVRSHAIKGVRFPRAVGAIEEGIVLERAVQHLIELDASDLVGGATLAFWHCNRFERLGHAAGCGEPRFPLSDLITPA